MANIRTADERRINVKMVHIIHNLRTHYIQIHPLNIGVFMYGYRAPLKTYHAENIRNCISYDLSFRPLHALVLSAGHTGSLSLKLAHAALFD